jgi:hypothetical protein
VKIGEKESKEQQFWAQLWCERVCVCGRGGVRGGATVLKFRKRRN